MIQLQVNHLKKTYATRFTGVKVDALKNVNFSVEEGEYIAIMGESGSGKSTLLNILATFDQPTSGEVLLGKDAINLATIGDGHVASFRRQNLGFVFQDFHLLDTFSLKDNILLPLVLGQVPVKEMEERLKPITQKLGIWDILHQFPYEVSGGQKQRTAVARALITAPKILLADEPTGALDSKSSDDMLDLFQEINEEGQTILMVTHSTKAASHASRVLFIKDGVVFHEMYRGEISQGEMFQKISNALTVMATGGTSCD